MVYTPFFDTSHTNLRWFTHRPHPKRPPNQELANRYPQRNSLITQVFNTPDQLRSPVDKSIRRKYITRPLSPEPAEPPPVAYRTGTSLVEMVRVAISLQWGRQT